MKYKGREYRSVSYIDKIKLFDKDDYLLWKVLYTVTKDEIEDHYTLFTNGILNGIKYVIYEIENEVVTYTKYINSKKYLKRPITNFELVYSQKNRKGHVETDIIFIDEKRIARDKVNQRFWPQEMASGNIMFSVAEELVTLEDLYMALDELYGERITDKGGIPEAAIFDQYFAWLSIDENKLDITSDWGIVTISPKDEKGNKYIFEIVDYLNRK